MPVKKDGRVLVVHCFFTEEGEKLPELVRQAFYREKSPKYGENLTIWPRNIIIYMMNGRLSQEV